MKAKGLGLSLPLDSFSVECAPELPAALVASEFAPDDVHCYRLWDLPVPAGFKAALAFCGNAAALPRMRKWSF
jgi:hypothetical protein